MSSRLPLLLLARLVMEGAWLTTLVAFFSLITGASQSVMPGVAVFGLVCVAFGVAYVLQHLDISETKLQLWGTLLAAATINGVAKFVVTGQPDFWNPLWPFAYLGGGAGTLDQGRQTLLALSLGVFLWWRGARAAEHIPNFRTVLIAFRAGVVFVAIQSILEGFVSIHDGASGMVVPFFIAGLCALTLAHLERVDRHHTIKLTGYGLLVPLGAIGAIGGLGLVVGLLPFAALGKALAKLGEVVDLATSFVFIFILLGVGYVAEWVILLINWLFSFVRAPIELSNPLGEEFLQRFREETSRPSTFDLILDLARIAFLVVLLLVALSLLARAFKRRSNREEAEIPEAHASISEGPAGQTVVPAWLQRLLSGLMGKGLPGVPAGLSGAFRVYFRMVQWAARAGVSRQPWRTPLEFQDELEKAFGLREGAIARITRAFMEARYGRRMPPPEEVRHLESDLQQLRGQGEAAAASEGVPRP